MSQHYEFEQMSNERSAINTDPREQAGQEAPASYTSQEMGGGPAQKIYPTPRRQRRWPVIVLIIVLAVGLLGTMGYLGNSVFGKTIVLPQHNFQVSGAPTLVIKNDTGKIQIHRGSDSQVSVKASEHTGLFGNPDDLQVVMTQNANEVEVTVTDKNGFNIINYESVDLDITLPALSNVQATVDTGNIEIDGVSGQINLETDTGNIDVENGDISGNSNLKTSTGNISFANGTLSDQALFSTDTGTITFDGRLAANGNYSFMADTGNIDLSLPDDSSFVLSATTDTGSVNNEFGSNSVGDQPTSKLQIQTDTGSISLHKK